MILRLALRSLATRPVRTAVLACGFGFGIAVMAALLGVGDVILEQAHSPALEGGGDLVVSGRFGPLENARFLIASVLASPDIAAQTVAVAPSRKATLYLIKDGRSTAVAVTGGVPSAERAVGDREIASVPGWNDVAADRGWSAPDRDDVLKAMDRFHRIPPRPEFAASWAEWLYFNGRSADGRLRFYLTFMVGPAAGPGRRSAGVRLQLDRDGKTTTYAAGEVVDEAAVLASAPDLDIAGNHVRLEGSRYLIALALPGASGRLLLDAAPGQSLPPATITGARGWITGYTAPVLSGRVEGELTVGRESVTLRGASGYHDHNWGFWKGVRWQWGQVASGDLSFVYGRIFPPPDVADPDRIPGFLGVLGAKGALGFSTAVTLNESDDDRGMPHKVTVRARGQALDLELVFSIDRSVRTAMAMTAAAPGAPVDFLQLGGEYRVTGKLGERTIDFTARGAAETFR
ncbi:MAG: hypothetical protein ACRD2I_19550 [Vicinamibacterales bacterium]